MAQVNIPDFNLGKNQTPILVVLLIIAAFLIGSLLTKVSYLEKGSSTSQTSGTTAGSQTQPTQPAPGQKVDVTLGHLPTLGNKNAKIEIVEFSDFQCPFCRSFWRDTLPQIKKEYIDTGKAVFAYRHLPLTSIHPGAVPAAEASECANEQGKFWQMHDKIFQEQDKQGQGTVQFTNDDLKKWAANLDLDSAKFNSCFDSKKYSKNVTEDEQDSQKIGATGTPTFVINGQLTVGAQPFQSFKTLIDQELSK